ncbi:MAG: type IV pili methyl-accepting chemotaxis transducer N-terminal domain-containing protein [Opitutales bacterium]|nr:type IV pili methyl-accepting chemotaxis transducer N-terminal domain-containing protein [Opitutales bacterium]
MKIRTKLIVALITLILGSTACIYLSFSIISQELEPWKERASSNGTIVNLAGRQRMLTQKMSKEAESVLAGNLQLIDALEGSRGAFASVINGLIYGDEGKNCLPLQQKKSPRPWMLPLSYGAIFHAMLTKLYLPEKQPQMETAKNFSLLRHFMPSKRFGKTMCRSLSR